MNTVLAVLELAQRHTREGGASLPHAVLHELVRDAGAQGGALGLGNRELARLGLDGGASLRIDLEVGRDAFWAELIGGREPDPTVRLAAGTVLGTWLVREELKKARFSERRRLWEVEALRAIGEALGGTLDPVRIAKELVLHITALLDARRGEVWLISGQGWSQWASIAGAAGLSPCADGSCTVAARVGGPILAVEEVIALPADGLVAGDRLAVPVSGRRGRLAVLALAEREVRGGTTPFTAADAETLALYASQAAVALENATFHSEALERERFERELELAATIQRQLLPDSFPAPPGFEIAARSVACRHVGGDIYDVVASERGAILMLADVAGKGVPAALMASSLHAAVHLLASSCPDVGELAQRLHGHLDAATPENKFATAFLACVREGGMLEYTSAGHNPTLLVLPDGSSELLGAGGPPLGLLPEARYVSEHTSLPPGALLVAYTDGLSEAPAASGEEFGVDGVERTVTRHRNAPLQEIITELFAEVERHTGGSALHDDRSVLVLRRHAV